VPDTDPLDARAGDDDGTTWYPLAFEPLFRWAAGWAVVHPQDSGVRLGRRWLVATFGPWTVSTPLANIEDATVTGPYAWPKVVGGPRLSFRDRGLTFAGTASRGVCLRFREPVHGIEPTGVVHHPGLTVTVADPDGFVADLRRRVEEADDGTEVVEPEVAAELERMDVEGHDELEGMTASELRQLAKDEGIAVRSSMRKAEVIDAIERAEVERGRDAAIEDALDDDRFDQRLDQDRARRRR
jgi:hypothetical protein